MTWWNRPKFKDYNGIVCDGSIRSGKTVTMTVGFILWSLSEFNNTSFAICSKTVMAARRNITSNIAEWLEGVVTVTENISQNKLIISDGKHTNTYYLFGGRDERSYALVQGMTLGGALLDEVALMPRSFVEQVLGRCSIRGSKYWFNCNPEGPTHWFYLEWIKKAEKHKVLHLHFTMSDNLSLDPEIKRRYETNYTGVFYQRYILGNWVRAEGLVYPMFSKNKHVVDYYGEKKRKKQALINPRHMYYVSVDYGVVNPFSAGLYDYDPAAQTVTRIKEFYYSGRNKASSDNDPQESTPRVDNEAYYQMLCDLIGDYPIQCIVIDPSAASMIETILKYGKWIVRRANNDVLNGIQDVTKYLNAGVLFFDKSCRSAFEEFHLYSWDDKSSTDAVIKENDHAMDEIRYFCRTILREELAFII